MTTTQFCLVISTEKSFWVLTAFNMLIIISVLFHEIVCNIVACISVAMQHAVFGSGR
jgi:hypothetical protein